MFTQEHIIGMVDLPRISPDAAIVRVSGDSMSPTVPSGAFVAVRDVTAAPAIFW